MGRTEKSQGLAPPAVRKDLRAKQARHIVNKVIPAILASNTKARKGADGSELIVDPAPTSTGAHADSETAIRQDGENDMYIKRTGQGRRKVKGTKDEGLDIIVRAGHENKEKTRGEPSREKNSPSGMRAGLSPARASMTDQLRPDRRVRIISTDTLSAARMLSVTAGLSRKKRNICILNMASPLRPGGGVLTGATSQEEFLCARTTLLPSLKESFYRLPEIGGIYTHDVLVFRSHLPLSDPKGELGPNERWWVDVVSAGMLRFPELHGEEGERKRLTKKDKELVEKKMRSVLRIATAKGVKSLVLGAWGCGAYGNPLQDIAEAWRRVLEGDSGSKDKRRSKPEPLETWDAIEEVVFAISNAKMANEFAQSYRTGMGVEPGPQARPKDDSEMETDPVVEELRAKIREMQSQISQVWNPDLKVRMAAILDGLRMQLQEHKGSDAEEDEINREVEDENADDESPIYGGVREESTQEHGMEDEGSAEDDGQDDGLVLRSSSVAV